MEETHPLDDKLSLKDVEKAHVTRVLEATGWHQGKSCEILAVSRPRLRRYIRHYNLIAPEGIGEDDDDAKTVNNRTRTCNSITFSKHSIRSMVAGVGLDTSCPTKKGLAVSS